MVGCDDLESAGHCLPRTTQSLFLAFLEELGGDVSGTRAALRLLTGELVS